MIVEIEVQPETAALLADARERGVSSAENTENAEISKGRT